MIGDIAGVLSGGLGAAIVSSLYAVFDALPATVLNMLLTALVASVTVGGKAVGKGIAQKHSDGIVNKIAVITYYTTKFFSFRKKDR